MINYFITFKKNEKKNYANYTSRIKSDSVQYKKNNIFQINLTYCFNVEYRTGNIEYSGRSRYFSEKSLTVARLHYSENQKIS